MTNRLRHRFEAGNYVLMRRGAAASDANGRLAARDPYTDSDLDDQSR